MSVEGLGTDLLGEVRVEGLDEVRRNPQPLLQLTSRSWINTPQLLRSLQEVDAKPESPLGFAPLDRLLSLFQNPPPTRQQQHYQTQWSVQQEGPIPPAREKPLPVIEITDAAACSGKTQLLYLLVSLSLLPAKHKDVCINGKGNAVVLLDLSGKFSVLRLHHVMRKHISAICSSSSVSLPEQEILSLVSDSFTHLHIFHPQSSSSLLATLASLPSFLLSSPSTHLSTNRRLGLLAINDLSAFLWQDRLDANGEAALPASNHAEKANSTLFLERYRNFISSLRHIQHLFSCTIVATNWGLAPVSSVAGHSALRPHLPSLWNNFCTLKVVVEREIVSKFAPGLSAEEAKMEAVQRWEAVKKSGFSGWINWWGIERWREEVREGIRGLKVGGRFSFNVTGDGIIVDHDCK